MRYVYAVILIFTICITAQARHRKVKVYHELKPVDTVYVDGDPKAVAFVPNAAFRLDQLKGCGVTVTNNLHLSGQAQDDANNNAHYVLSLIWAPLPYSGMFSNVMVGGKLTDRKGNEIWTTRVTSNGLSAGVENVISEFTKGVCNSHESQIQKVETK